MYERERRRVFGDVDADTVTIGIQIRWGRGKSDFYLTDYDTDIQKFWDCAYNLAQTEMQHGKKVIFFLATDTKDIRKRTVDFFTHNISTPIPVRHISPELEVKRDGDKVSAIIDQKLLSECDDMIVTMLSTFGYHAHASTLKIPMVVNRMQKICWRRIDSQSGQVTRGGSWPWGDSICKQDFPCCEGKLHEFWSYFLPTG